MYNNLIKYNLFFTLPINSRNNMGRAKRVVWLINVLALAVTLTGMLLVIYLSLSPQFGGTAQVVYIALGLATIFLGSHILWAGLASLKRLDEHQELEEVGEE